MSPFQKLKSGPSSLPTILHLSSNRNWGGGENQVRLLMQQLSKYNIDQLCVCPAGSPLAQRLHNLHLPVKPIKWTSGSDPRALVSVARTLKHFDVVHCHDAAALQIALIPARLRGVRLIASRRVRFKTSAFKWNRADRIIAVSQTVREALLEAGVKDHKIQVIHSGTDLSETRNVKPFDPTLRQKLGLRDGTFVVGNAGAFYAGKRQALIAEAAAMLPDVHWFLAGEGPERGNIEAAIARYAVGDRVHLLGWLNDARQMLKELDVYVSTSIDDGLGNSITESLALQIPVLVAEAGGPAEIMRPITGKAGPVMFAPDNARSLAKAIEKLREPERRQRIIEAQDERFRDFDIEQTAAMTLGAYHV